MIAINLDDQIVGSTFNPQTRICTYTYEHHDGSRYTVEVPLEELTKLGTTPMNRVTRRNHLATKIMTHMQSNGPDKE